MANQPNVTAAQVLEAILNPEALYTLARKKETDEYHLFASRIDAEDVCRLKRKSICGGMESQERDTVKFACQEEDAARLKCAKVGKRVCGPCVSHLYLSHPKK